jgi:hypothetical protein
MYDFVILRILLMLLLDWQGSAFVMNEYVYQ